MSRDRVLALACLVVLLAAPAATAQTRTVTVAVAVEDGGPEGGPYTTELDPARVPVDVEVTCDGPEVPAKLVELDVFALVEETDGSPIEEFDVRVEPSTVEFVFPEQGCVTGPETQNETVMVTVTPGHLSLYNDPVRILVWAESAAIGANESATFHVRPGLSGSVSLSFPTKSFETDNRTAYAASYRVLNDMNSEVKVLWGAPANETLHFVSGVPFVACNTHAEGCTGAGLDHRLEVVPPQNATERVEEQVTLPYAIQTVADDVVLEEGSVTLTLVFDPAGDAAEEENGESPVPGGPFLLLVVMALLALARTRGRS